ncbi:hypothetical protein [Mycobacterium gastri]|uniref:Polyketide cyclase n=1 Tax=Mycobacterium gastri TaxID=1777 RepID=A0A1X1W1R8_MYCGS|nr:hypothetical protein [Mycobacterium gastri]ETW21893.1 polyketide cyclase [Mycobacterium gastri 'Wayne']ORV80185.1 hypothetical protein AWC07_21945 [Mycobacterium gastri]
MVEIHVQRTIAAPVEKVFDWLADPHALTAAPLVLRAGYTKDSSSPGPGAVREVVGLGTWFDWLTTYTHPARAGGNLLAAVTRPLLRSSFLAILAACAKTLES